MPASFPRIGKATAASLATVGARLRTRRKALGISAVAAAEAAGMSRVTWHRIERGEPSVAAGAYLSAIAALGLRIDVFDPEERARSASHAKKKLPSAIRLSDFPQLARVAWQRKEGSSLTPKEAFGLYERNWRHVDVAALKPEERELVRLLTDAFGQGRLLV